jgi:predicted amidophosphoribosyltransferase
VPDSGTSQPAYQSKQHFPSVRVPAYSIIRQVFDSMFAVVFPTACAICAREMRTAAWIHVCPECWQHLRPWKGASCSCCGVPFASELAGSAGLASKINSSAGPQAGLCGQCRTGAYEFDLARSYGLYRGDLRAVILQLKFKGRERLGWRLGELLAFVCNSSAGLQQVFGRDSPPDEPALLVPVPLHESRARQRGFNQAELLARGLAKALRRPGRISEFQPQQLSLAGSAIQPSFRLATRCLQRVRSSLPQSGLSLRARRENVRGVFQTTCHEDVRGRNVLLVDDVMTTGATLSACAGVLKRAGASRVIALSLARATPQFPDAIASAGAGIARPTD